MGCVNDLTPNPQPSSYQLFLLKPSLGRNAQSIKWCCRQGVEGDVQLDPDIGAELLNGDL